MLGWPAVMRTTGIGASRPLTSVPAKVASQSRQRSLSPSGGNWSSCHKTDLSLAAETGYSAASGFSAFGCFSASTRCVRTCSSTTSAISPATAPRTPAIRCITFSHPTSLCNACSIASTWPGIRRTRARPDQPDLSLRRNKSFRLMLASEVARGVIVFVWRRRLRNCATAST